MTTREIAAAWRGALDGLFVRHPDPDALPYWLVSDDGHLHVGCGNVHDTLTGAVRDLPVASVRLTYFPGDGLARRWFAAGWAGYVTHEALELVKYEGRPPLDPHEEPYATNPFNRGLRDGFPPVLTPGSLERALAVVMDPADARKVVDNKDGAAVMEKQ